ncbi:hypothetical protein [Flammeovirga sp. EKP202]|uniref:hypothetical protein n=1 Tax=Flammeovirga sp. EKP202 TaxID=2770592 RepID=UPI00165F2773|nr:hypothetical protein [Flammeovirga sp. EKP202]MBD0400502.1 hypothetical protein [Flammeovirga sp. EKP202]
MQGEGIIYKILFIITLSTVFPMIGYYLDYRHKRKMFRQHPSQKGKSVQENK